MKISKIVISSIGAEMAATARRRMGLALAAAALLWLPMRALPQGTGFTYQGQLANAGLPANGTFDFTFTIWNAASAGNLLAGPLTNAAVSASNGLFTVWLDFGPGIFTGPGRWLEISVRAAGNDAFSLLAPRQSVSPTPYAIQAGKAGSANSAATLSGTLLPTNIGAGVIAASNLAPNAVTANLNAAGQTAVASGGLIFSATDNNTNLANAGYIRIYGSFNLPDAWQSFTNPAAVGAPIARSGHTAVWTGSEMILWGGLGGGVYLNDGGRYNPAVDAWTALPLNAGGTPTGRQSHAAVWTGSAMIIWGGLGGTNYYRDGGIYDPVLNGWTYVPASLANTPQARLHHSAVWTGNAMLVWGGVSAVGTLNDGGAFSPGLMAWTALPGTMVNAPPPREFHSAIWTGTEMIVWGGDQNGAGALLNDGGRYNPTANAWTYMPGNSGAPGARANHTAVWSGAEMLVWGGGGVSGDLNDGGRYNPTIGTWSAILPTLNLTPIAREAHSAIWSGSELIIWGGLNVATMAMLNDGGRYNPLANSWTAIPGTLPNAPAPRFHHSVVWSGTEMIVWGGAGIGNQWNDGGRFNPVTQSWTYLPGSPANTPPPSRADHSAVWTGTEMIVWGGANGSIYFNDGGRFNPALSTWSYLPSTLPNTPVARTGQSAVWTGTEMVIWGGLNAGGWLNDGGRYNPATASWIALAGSLPNTPAPRNNHASIWTGTNLIVWGGLGQTGPLSDGGILNPPSSSWTTISAALPNTPGPRAGASAVWTGNQMIVWGGSSNSMLYADGGRFSPAANSWISLPGNLPNTPPARSGVPAVWTGTEMIVWGGLGGTGTLNDGGRYNPTANTWTALAGNQTATPAARAQNTAIWTGTEMVVWGGLNGASYYADGGRFNPALNQWNAISSSVASAPAARARHSAVWTGSQMLTWGGLSQATAFNDTFGLTPGRVLFLYQRP